MGWVHSFGVRKVPFQGTELGTEGIWVGQGLEAFKIGGKLEGYRRLRITVSGIIFPLRFLNAWDY